MLLLITTAVAAFTGCAFGGNNSGSDSAPQIETVDYVAQTTLDMTSPRARLEINPTNAKGEKTYTHIDGDTTHFNVPKSFGNGTGTFKARYLAVDTPESTGDIEEWGKKASAFTKEKLASATSIILESDKPTFEEDTNQRYLAWVWYKPESSEEYRLLNLELLQEGLAVGSIVENSVYNTVCVQATRQAETLKLYVHSKDKDPDFYYGDAIQTTLKTVRSDLSQFKGKRVSITGVVSAYKSKGSLYIEYYDEEAGRSYGIPIFYGLNKPQYDPFFSVGNDVRIVGEISYSEAFGYQISGLKYDYMKPDDPENIRVISANNELIYMTPTVEEFSANNYAYAESHLYSSISMTDLTVVDTYTTQNGGDSNGAMTLTCQDANGKQIEVRTNVLKDENNNIITADAYQDKTISVKGIIEVYKGDYQINVFGANSITVLN